MYSQSWFCYGPPAPMLRAAEDRDRQRWRQFYVAGVLPAPTLLPNTCEGILQNSPNQGKRDQGIDNAIHDLRRVAVGVCFLMGMLVSVRVDDHVRLWVDALHFLVFRARAVAW